MQVKLRKIVPSADGEAEEERVRCDQACCDDNPCCGTVYILDSAQFPHHLPVLFPTVSRDSHVSREHKDRCGIRRYVVGHGWVQSWMSRVAQFQVRCSMCRLPSLYSSLAFK
jgi:hypothetical protein